MRLALTVVALVAATFIPSDSGQTPQQVTKPAVEISLLPSEPIPTTGTCTSSTGGYLMDKHGQTHFTTAEFGKLIQSSLQNGYVMTVYPETKSGFFVSMKCIANPTAAH
ncbi:MAG: hypothetical protein WBE72_12625 [Terracidiphilus sp.]